MQTATYLAYYLTKYLKSVNKHSQRSSIATIGC